MSNIAHAGNVRALNQNAPVVFVHDAAIDEYIASLLLTLMSGVHLVGIIVINADCLADTAMEAASRLLQFMGRTEIPLALSRTRGWNAFPWSYRGDCVRFNQIPSLQQYQPQVSVPPPDGEELLTRLLAQAAENNQPLTLLMTGPLTPLVAVLDRDPSLSRGVGRIVWMGGAIDVPGNLDPSTIDPSVANKHAEWNAFWDPYSVHDILESFGNIHIFPLDISNTAPVSADFLAALQKQGQTSRYSQLAYEAYSLVVDEPFYRLWDVTAACWLARPELYCQPQPMPLTIEQWGFEQGWIHKPLQPGVETTQNVYFNFTDLPGFYQYVLDLLARS
ncbi:MAG TPA: nucleoside hydrolase [Terracidiphilus sp.]|jgi:purine nucleosidase|nr:nucleoside hydrolase [Terracidiphilus sp.]